MAKKRKKGHLILGILLVVVAFISIRSLLNFEIFGNLANKKTEGVTGNFSREYARFYSDVNFNMFSGHALLINLTTGDILFEHASDVRVYPASLTKIMTVLLGIEQAYGATMTVRADFAQLIYDNASIVGFEYGEQRLASEIFHGAMLPSGADATATIAYHVGGSYHGFVGLMNEKAQSLGMYDTHFMNASGLHHPNHYTTAYDIAILLSHALENSTFRTIFTTRVYSFINRSGEEQYMHSTLFSNLWATEFEGGEIVGGRTGFTYAAGRCLATLATNGYDEFILITLGANSIDEDGRTHIADAFTIYQYFLK